MVRPTFWSWASRASSSNRISRPSSPPPACGHVLRAKGFVQDENGWVELNTTADGLTANAIPKGQEVLIVIGEGLEKERIEVRLKG